MQINIKDIGAGALFLAIGLFFTLNSWFKLPIGNGYSMGPGFFPIGLGILLTCFGLGILVKAMRTGASEIGPIPVRGLTLIVLSVLVFAVTIEGLGVVLALASSTLLAAMAPSDANWKSATITTAALTAFCILVFIYALRLPYPLIGTWLTGR